MAVAQDAAQGAFIDAYLSLSSLREPAAFPGWFRRVIVEHADRHVRARRVVTARLDAMLEIASDLPGPAETVETEVARLQHLARRHPRGHPRDHRRRVG